MRRPGAALSGRRLLPMEPACSPTSVPALWSRENSVPWVGYCSPQPLTRVWFHERCSLEHLPQASTQCPAPSWTCSRTCNPHGCDGEEGHAPRLQGCPVLWQRPWPPTFGTCPKAIGSRRGKKERDPVRLNSLDPHLSSSRALPGAATGSVEAGQVGGQEDSHVQGPWARGWDLGGDVP